MPLLKLAAKRLVAQRMLAVALLITMAFAIGVLAAGPIYADASKQAILTGEVTQSDATVKNVRFTLNPTAGLSPIQLQSRVGTVLHGLPALLSADGLVRTYPGRAGVTALKGVSVSVGPGDFVALMGPSGSGKTTFLGLLSGLDRPERGRVHWHGTPIDELGPAEHRDLRRASIGVVFQSFGLLPTLSALENVELPLRVAGVPLDRAEQEATHLLERLGLSDRLENRTFELSAGQQQRVAVARALVTSPEVVLADEPIAEVDTENADLILDALADVSRRGGAVLAATHNPAALSYAGRVVLLRDGTVEATGTPQEMAGRISTD